MAVLVQQDIGRLQVPVYDESRIETVFHAKKKTKKARLAKPDLTFDPRK